MSTDAGVAYLRSLIPRDGGLPTSFGLDRIRRMLAALGDPHVGPHFVHVGGTSGKGSTAHLLASILTAAGYRTGLHVSPHVVAESERLQVNGMAITDTDLAELAASIRSVSDSIALQLSYFEALWTAALLQFQRSHTHVNVVEVGLGGEWDATNVIDSRYQVLTNIDLDHTAVLGNTKAAILRVKQGIVKPRSQVVSGIRQPHLRAILEEDAHRKAAMALRLAEEWPCIGEDAIRAGLVDCKPPGRVDIIAREPLVIYDSAHNPAKMRWLAKAIRELFPLRRFITVVRYAQRPDIWTSIAILATFSEEIILTDSQRPGDMGRSPGYDGAAATHAKKEFGATAIRSPQEAVYTAVERAKTQANVGVLVTGSIYMLQELYETVPRCFPRENAE